jgi:Bacterial Ig-like domain (group 1)
MLRPRSPHPLRRPRSHFWTVAVLLATSSLGCDDDDPIITLPTPSTMEIIAGDGQAGRVSQELPDPLVVRVLDASGAPVEGVSVVWAAQGGGSVSPDTVLTDSDGMAAVQLVLGSTAGDQFTTAAVSEAFGIPPVTFTTRAVAEE